MNWIDLAILIWLLSAIYRGYSAGFIRICLSFGGFLFGLLLGGWLATLMANAIDAGAARLIPGFIFTLILGLVFALLGERMAIRLKNRIRIPTAHHINNILGSVSGALLVLTSSWLIATALVRLPFANLGLAIEQSRIVRSMNVVMPDAPRALDKLGRLISPQGFPDVFVGQEPIFDNAGPPVTAEVEAAANKSQASMTRIEGYACGDISTGSGFIAAPNHIITNAHVVAGVRSPIILHEGKRYSSKVVLFNARKDFAVLRTDKPLPGPVLTLAAKRVPRSTSTAVLGYPGGGGLRISPGIVLRSQLALGRDIYDSGVVTREIYALQTNIEPGSSGGPVVLPDGTVAGVIFGEAVTRDDMGYALTAHEIADDLENAIRRSSPVSSGKCL